MLSHKEMKAMKKDELIRLLTESQERSLLESAKSSVCDEENPTSQQQVSDETISFQTLKSYLSKAVMELKEELSLDFNQRFATISAEVLTLREEVASLKNEIDATHEKIKSEILNELHERESRKNNVMIFGAKEQDGTSSMDVRENDRKYLTSLTKTLGMSQCKFHTFFRLGSLKNRNFHPRPLKLCFESHLERDEFLRAATVLRKRDSDALFGGVFIKPDLSPSEQETEKKLRRELRLRREEGERVVIRRGRIVSETPASAARNL